MAGGAVTSRLADKSAVGAVNRPLLLPDVRLPTTISYTRFAIFH